MADLRVPDLNIVLIAGRVVREPDVRSTPTGRTVARFTLANNRRFKARDGEFKDDTVFVNVVIWDRQAEMAHQRLYKGRPVLVEGRLRLDEWEDRNSGQRRSRLEIVAWRISFLDKESASIGEFDVEELPPDEFGDTYPENGPKSPKGNIPSPGNNMAQKNWDVPSEDDVPF